VGVAVVALGGGMIFILHRQNEAALQAQASASAAAARAAASAKSNDFDLGKALVDLGGSLLDKAIVYAVGGAAGVAADQARQTAFQV
jgi:hypothetical protein